MCPRLEPQQYFVVACCSGRANVAVARVSCIWRVSAAVEAATGYFVWAAVACTFCAEIARLLDENRVSESAQIETPVRHSNKVRVKCCRGSSFVHMEGAECAQTLAAAMFGGSMLQWNGECGCASSFLHLEGVRGGGSSDWLFRLGGCPVHVLRRDTIFYRKSCKCFGLREACASLLARACLRELACASLLEYW